MACRFAKVSEEEIEEAFFYPSDLVNTETTTPLRVGEEWWIYLDTFCLGISPLLFTFPLQVVVYYAIKKISSMPEDAAMRYLCWQYTCSILG